MPRLLIITPAPVIETAAGEVVLDTDFVEGMKLHCQLWPGPVTCLMRRGAGQVPRPLRFAPQQLEFDLSILGAQEKLPALLLEEASLVYCAADDMRHLDLPENLHGRMARLVYMVEQPLSGRLHAALAGRRRSLRKRLHTALWTLNREAALRGALARADGLHCNGLPAWRAYRRLNARGLCYLDNRLRRTMMASADDQAARAERLRSGAPLRLVYFGPLEAESGLQDVLAAAHLADNAGLDFRLDIYGEGALAPRLADGIASLKLGGRLRLSPSPGFDTVLVPLLRREADIFLAPRRLSDPLSNYVEAMGCGLPVLGYRNAMWRALQAGSGAGWTVPARPGAMLRQLLHLNRDREPVIAASQRGLNFARKNTFESVFSQRMCHLRQLAGID
ncbi:MAG: glycosyltransferase [Pararhodobacter sp.]|nr:glycosyltransferase [Pararhodobacter sp.]